MSSSVSVAVRVRRCGMAGMSAAAIRNPTARVPGHAPQSGARSPHSKPGLAGAEGNDWPVCQKCVSDQKSACDRNNYKPVWTAATRRRSLRRDLSRRVGPNQLPANSRSTRRMRAVPGGLRVRQECLTYWPCRVSRPFLADSDMGAKSPMRPRGRVPGKRLVAHGRGLLIYKRAHAQGGRAGS